jgi:hypothetical protein
MEYEKFGNGVISIDAQNKHHGKDGTTKKPYDLVAKQL